MSELNPINKNVLRESLKKSKKGWTFDNIEYVIRAVACYEAQEAIESLKLKKKKIKEIK